MSVRFELCDAHTVQRYAEDLRALERSITYPLGDGRERFFIDHGEGYHRFFSTMGDAYFLVALDGPSVVGVIVGVLKRCAHEGRSWQSAYLCDLKIASTHRGAGLPAAMLREALRYSATRAPLRQWKMAYGAAMRGDRGDVMRSATSAFHPAKLAATWATTRLYFASSSQLSALDAKGCPDNPSALLDLSPDGRVESIDEPLGLVSTAGRKDLRLVSSGAPWPLVHMVCSPERYRGGMAAHLRACGEALSQRGEQGLVCFALDARLRAHIAWLSGRGITSDTVCTVYAMRLWNGPPSAPVVHLATSEI